MIGSNRVLLLVPLAEEHVDVDAPMVSGRVPGDRRELVGGAEDPLHRLQVFEANICHLLVLLVVAWATLGTFVGACQKRRRL